MACFMTSARSLCPDAVLNKPERLTDEEYEVMKKHTVWGREILSGLEFLPQADLGATYHHERYDGSGYPYGCTGRSFRRWSALSVRRMR